MSLKDWNLVVERNLDGFTPIIKEKFGRMQWLIFKSCPQIVITLQDMR